MASTLQETLTRLSSKPGVQATLVLSRKDGAVIQSSGFPSSDALDQTQPTDSNVSAGERVQNWSSNANGIDEATEPTIMSSRNQKTAEATARAVFQYVSSAGQFIGGVGGPDEVQLLRVRTRKQEIVIVPDQNYLLVVFQDVSKSG